MFTLSNLLSLTCSLLLFTGSIHPILPSKSNLEQRLEQSGFLDISVLDPTIMIDLKYATTDNFTQSVLYDSLHRAYLHPDAAYKLLHAQKYLKEIRPEYSLLVYDATRPLSVQREMYQVVENTPYSAYVAHPDRTGLHNYGLAVDLTICDQSGNILDMGTPFDFFGKAAGINREEELVSQGILTHQQVNNRKLLRNVMQKAGFSPIRGEWWHFNAVSLQEARTNYQTVK